MEWHQKKVNDLAHCKIVKKGNLATFAKATSELKIGGKN